jgi:DNA-binding NtrC family response regulator
MNFFNEIKKLKTLLVDDDEFIRDALKIAFSAKGCAIQVAESAEDGLRAIREEKFDIIISDFRLPGMNGLDFIRKTVAAQPDAVRFLITAYRDDRIRSEALKMGATQFIDKPFSVKALVTRLALSLKKQKEKRSSAGKILN